MTDVHRSSDPQPYKPFSKRELEILRLMAKGMSDRQIAEHLVLAHTTVKWYNRQLFNKLNARSRTEAVEQARILGLISLSKHNLPAPLTPFVERRHELTDLLQLLGDEHIRLITLLSPGGMGKTRLALELAERILNPSISSHARPLEGAGNTVRFPDGVYFVSLEAISASEYMLPAIAYAVGFQFYRGSEPKQQLLDFFNEKRMLLVLDNFEHLLKGALLVADLLRAAPGLKIIVTSQEKLNLSGETVYTLGGMSFPDQVADNALDYNAVQLFVHCARRVQPSFTLAGSTEAVIRICQWVQGMPLAIELAAAWVGVLSPTEIANAIRDSLDFLQTKMRDLPERQRSVRAVFEAAWGRLTEDEQVVFAKLSVFRGGCTPEAAQVVAGACVEILIELADKAMLWRNPETHRYQIHELLRYYAEEQLEKLGTADVVKDVHSTYYASFMQRREKDLKGRRQMAALGEIELELENIVRGFQWAVGRGQHPTAQKYVDGLSRALEWSGRYQEQENLFVFAERALPAHEAGNGRVLMGQILGWKGRYLLTFGYYAETKHVLQQTLLIARECGDRVPMARCLSSLAASLAHLGQLDEAWQLANESLVIARELDDPSLIAESLSTLGGILHFYPNQAEEQRHLTGAALALSQEIGDRFGTAVLLHNLGVTFLRANQYEEAAIYAQESCVIWRELGMKINVIFPIRTLAIVAFHQGELEEAEAYIDEAMAIVSDLNLKLRIRFFLAERSRLYAVRGQYNQARVLAEEALRVEGAFSDAHSHPRYLFVWRPNRTQFRPVRFGRYSGCRVASV